MHEHYCLILNTHHPNAIFVFGVVFNLTLKFVATMRILTVLFILPTSLEKFIIDTAYTQYNVRVHS